MPPDIPRVLHVVNSLSRGGTERTLVALLNAISCGRLRHSVVTLRQAGPLAPQLPDDVSCQALGIHGPSWRSGIELARIVRAQGTDIIHARNTGCWWDAIVAASLVPRTRLVLSFHGLDLRPTFSRRQRWIGRIGRLRGARFLSVSESGRSQLQHELGIPESHISVIPNGVDLRRFGDLTQEARTLMRASLGFLPGDFVVGIVGSLVPVKQHAVLIAAVARVVIEVPHLRLLIVGDGPLRPSLMEQCQSAGIHEHVRFARFREDVPEMLGCIETLVCCSDSEGMSNAILEALAAGLPVIASNVGDNRRMVRHGTEGFITAPRRPEEIAEAIKCLARDTELRERMASAANARAASFDFPSMVEAYRALYHRLLGPTGEPIASAKTLERAGRPLT